MGLTKKHGSAKHIVYRACWNHHCLFFVNPIQIAPGSAPEDEIKEFNNGQLVVYGPGIHLPNNKYRFWGPGENESLRELYAPGDAYIHGGFVFKQKSYAIKVWGRAIYSDEMFDLYLSSTEYDYSVSGRTPWSNISNLQGTAFSVGNYYWEARVLFLNQTATPSSLVGFTNIGGRMGPTVSNAGNMELLISITVMVVILLLKDQHGVQNIAFD